MAIGFIELLLLILLITSSSSKRSCSKHEIYKACPGCSSTCQRGKPVICFVRCTYECVCKDPYKRDEVSKKCVKVCPQQLTTETIILTPSHDDNPRSGTLHRLKGLH